ncbi:hypothetical protein F5Y13DRAFT_177208 [Hypoxylon sp. FL1857]|nr:hypothetical protein F5Y13DRAFT_177208 [Hypoxylon sp. FL1857]
MKLPSLYNIFKGEKGVYNDLPASDLESEETLLGEHNKNIPLRSNKPSTLHRIAVIGGRITLILLSVWGIFSLYETTAYYVAQSRNPSEKFAAPLYPSCSCGGTTVAEAKQRGCIFTPLAIAWLPPHCVDMELSNEFDKQGPGPNGEWDYWSDINMTRRLTRDEVGDLADHNGVMLMITVTDTSKSLDAVPPLGKLRYVAGGHVPQASPHNLHLPDLSEFGDERFLPLYSVRPIPTVSELPKSINSAQLDTHGFTAVHHTTALHESPYSSGSFKDPELLKQYLIPDTAEMIKQITGCKTVVTEFLLLRTSVWTPTDSLATHGEDAMEASELETGFPQFVGFNPKHGGASPASKIHLDFSPNGARTHIRRFHPDFAKAAADIICHEDSLLAAGKDLKESYKSSGGPRWALYSIWRPLKTVKRDPLAVIDNRSFTEEDCIPVNVQFPSLGTGSNETYVSESLLARYSDKHRWYWIDKQTPQDVLVLRFFDSDAEADGRVSAGGTFHSSVELPGMENEAPRESLEIRCLCIW